MKDKKNKYKCLIAKNAEDKEHYKRANRIVKERKSKRERIECEK